MEYKKGLQHGREITYDDEGKLIKDENFVHGKKEGLETGFDHEGRKIYQAFYHNGKKDGKEIFYDYSSSKEPVITEIIWENGVIVK